MFLKQKGTERKRNETKEERKKCFLGNYMLLRIEREKKYYFPRTRNFWKKENETKKRKKEMLFIFFSELYASANRKREKVPFFQSPNKKLFLKKKKQNERKEGMFSRKLYTPMNIERERKRKYHFSSPWIRNFFWRNGNVSSRIIYFCEHRERERMREKERKKKYHFSSRCSPNKKLLKEWKCFLANYIFLRTYRERETERERERKRKSTIFPVYVPRTRNFWRNGNVSMNYILLRA